MKSFSTYTMIIFLGIFLAYNGAFAGGRVEIFELAESGILIEFPMTAAEIAAEDARNAHLAAERTARAAAPQKRLEQFELAESGGVYEFPMTAEEIVAEDIEKAIRATMRKRSTRMVKVPVEVFELAESGQKIEFPAAATRSAPELRGTEIVRGNPAESGLSVR